MELAALPPIAKRIRADILSMCAAANSGHATSALSSVEIATALFFRWYRYDLSLTSNPGNDRFILSKGHASPLLYALYAAAGVISDEELYTYRKFQSPLEGHPTRRFRFSEAATGSLGQGLAIAIGQALALRWATHGDIHTPVGSRPHLWVLLGDGELAEGSVWEAAAIASSYGLNNLTCMVDVNGLGQSAPTMLKHDTETLRRRFESFGWGVMVVDGHDFGQLDAAYQKVLDYKAGPTVILANTVKGKGVAEIEGKEGWHGKPITGDMLAKALSDLGKIDRTTGVIEKLEEIGQTTAKAPPTIKIQPMAAYKKGEKTATRMAFGNALKRLGSTFPEMIVIDGDMQNSTFTELFAKDYPSNFVEGYIAEQTLTGMAVGLSVRGLKPVVSTFGSFLTRSFDQIRMAAISHADILFNGSHAGVSMGQDGPSQMGLEDIALFRTVHDSTILYPSDAVSCEKLTEAALQQWGIRYIRTTRPETPHLYDSEEKFSIGGSKTFSSDRKEVVTVVAAGITLHEALAAQKVLAADNIGIRVVDCYSVKPIDIGMLQKAITETEGIIVVEDHYPEGGLGEAVLSALSGISHKPVVHLAVGKMPMSGKPEELLAYEGIDAKSIEAAVKGYLGTEGK